MKYDNETHFDSNTCKTRFSKIRDASTIEGYHINLNMKQRKPENPDNHKRSKKLRIQIQYILY